MDGQDKLFVVVSKGRTPRNARAILVTEDEDLCRGVARLIADALGTTEARLRLFETSDGDEVER